MAKVKDPAFPTAASEASPSVKNADLANVVDILQNDIDLICDTLNKCSSGMTPPPSQQLPYLEDAVRILMGSKGSLKLKAKYTLENGEDSIKRGTVDLREHEGSSVDLLARLTLYLLLTRERLSKIVEEKSKSIDLGPYSMFFSESFERKKEKRLLLQSNELSQVKSVHSLYCNDPEFSLRALQILAPSLEDIRVCGAGPSHLKILCTMPKLRRLELKYSVFPINNLGPFVWADQSNCPAKSKNNNFQDTTRAWMFDDIPLFHDGLAWLKVDLPRQVLYPFIALHRRTLRELIIRADIPWYPKNDDEQEWIPQRPYICNDLPERMAELIQRCPMESLRMLELYRTHSQWVEEVALCEEQLRALRRILGPAVEVRCNRCG